MDNSENSLKKKFGKLDGPLKKYAPYIFLFILTLIVTLITYYRVLIQIEIGPVWDTYDFLSDALVFAGQGMGYADLTRPPLLPFITSIFFRLGYASPTTIFVVDGVMFIFGVIGFYLLLKLRFNEIESFLGSLLYATFPIVISFVGVGLSDIPSVSLSIWAFYFTVLAVKKNSKFFYLSFPFVMFAFLTRYPAALMIFPMFLYILINRDITKKIKDITVGIVASLLFIIPVLIFSYQKFGNPLYTFIAFFGLTSTSTPISPENFSYNTNLLYFLENLPSYIGAQGVAVILIILLGIIIYAGFNLRKSRDKKKLSFIFNFESSNIKIKLAIFLVFLLTFVGTFGQIFYMLSEVIFFVMCYVFYDLSKNLNIKDMDIHLLFFAWFMAFFIFHSVFVIKDNRYFVTMAPAVAYFLILGLSGVTGKLKFKVKNRNLMFPIFALILTIMILASTISYLPSVKQANTNLKVLDDNVASASEWFVNYDPDYKNKTIYSDVSPYSGWYLKTNVKLMLIFKDNQSYSGGVKDYNFSPEDSKAFNQHLKNNNVDYYFCINKGLNLTSYKTVKQFGYVVIYEKKP
ncbi:glycosyltransferase family 39 protein [Methanobacterium paludis]|uniref:Glycosyltransferase RgtA/B/C/D-like domain-containing protein n=1 Tax=Methanobacterium paludis (strain DSM 25820 / JCM 18151 / SWAN1) TaxID=868131 RepID=F6D8A6_METPW|nr:glycosyltransferase family 39 protein [Methanobacterium paludis]AEG18540.1 hypothetical protein MSWAN_1526 [Methanobacterium paludis]